MKYFNWDDDKNEILKRQRGISFEIIITQIEAGKLLDILGHPNPDKYDNQRLFVVEFDDYAFIVPFVEDENEIFLKTIIPSRKATKRYLRGK